MGSTWTMDYSWQSGHDPHEYAYDLQADFEPSSVAAATFEELSDELTLDAETGALLSGGAFAIQSGEGRITATSGGEDACDSLSYLADDITERATQIDPEVRITWTQLAPRPSDGGPPAARIDGYWIPSDEAQGYHARRDRLVERVRTAVGDACDDVRLEERDGLTTLVGRRNGVVVFDLGVGSTQLDMIEQADAAGTLREYALG